MKTKFHEERAPCFELRLLNVKATCELLKIPPRVSVWTPRAGVNWWQPLGLPADSGGVWVCSSADGPVIGRRDRQAHSSQGLAAPLLDG